MEKKQLDLDKPLLSVRRFSSASRDRKKSDDLPSTTSPLASDYSSSPVRSPGLVPFQWEQTPGRPKHKTGRKKKNSRVGEYDVKESRSSEEEDVFLDALSRSESLVGDCDADGPVGEPSGSFPSDPPTLEFMMGRFLPAAQEVTFKAPSNGTKKQPDQPRRKMKVFNRAKHRPLFKNNPSKFADLRDDGYDRPRNTMVGVCGLFPQLCLKSSFCLLSPVPERRMQLQRSVSLCRLPDQASHGRGRRPIRRNRRMEKQPIFKSSHDSSILYRSGMPRPSEKANNLRISDIISHNVNIQSKSVSISPVVEKTSKVQKVKSELTTSQEKHSKKIENASLDFWRTDELPRSIVTYNRGKIDQESEMRVQKAKSALTDCQRGDTSLDSWSTDEYPGTIVSYKPREIDRESEMYKAVKFDSEKEVCLNLGSRGSNGEFPVPPPLPDAPSDSWLSRAVSARSSFACSTRNSFSIKCAPSTLHGINVCPGNTT